ncbi:MAG: hypothetical protein JSR77_16665 [Planctomycetes bacterium]|nr:hypothetical protein [Planctomycetota bacterium]
MRSLHLGDLLVRHGVLTEGQRDEVLEAQRERGGAFGAVAEEMFGVSPSAVERAWAEQYAAFAPHVDPRSYNINPRALEAISRRQAWQFCILPLEISKDDLLACTTQDHLVRALKFAGWRLGHACQFVIAEPLHLGETMCKHYPMAGMSPESVLHGVGVG